MFSLLWGIKGKECSKPSFITVDIHISCTEYVAPNSLLKALRKLVAATRQLSDEAAVSEG